MTATRPSCREHPCPECGHPHRPPGRTATGTRGAQDRRVAELLTFARHLGAIRSGEFQLSQGTPSPYYFDGRILSLHPRTAHLIGQSVLQLAQEAQAQAVGGPTLGADPIVAATMLASRHLPTPMPGFIIRKEPKDHGAMRLIEGPLHPGSHVAIVDDVCSTGATIQRGIEALAGLDCTIAAVIALLDRPDQGGSNTIRQKGYPFQSLLTMQDDGDIRPTPRDQMHPGTNSQE